MRKYLVFYPVDNELGFDRHTFDAMTDEEAWKELQKSEWIRVYDMTRSDRNGRMLDMGDFVEDYNDEELDGGWWSIVLTIPDEEEKKGEPLSDNDFLHETIADIAFNMGWEHVDDIDSMEMVRCIIRWAKEFEKVHKGTDWESRTDYLTEIDEFSSTKLAEYLLGKK